MRQLITSTTAIAVAAGIAGVLNPATAAEEITTPYEEKLLEQGVEIPAETEQGQTQGQQEQKKAQPQQGQTQAQQEQTQGEEQAQQGDALIAKVGGEEIRRSDVDEAITELPPEAQQTPPQMLLPAVVDQLITRELIVQEARSENLQQDPEVRSLTESGTAATEEEALVDVWAKREVSERVTEEDVQTAVEEVKAANPDMEDTPGLAAQVERALQVRAMADISDELRQGADITFYGPAGEPVDMQDQNQAGQGTQ